MGTPDGQRNQFPINASIRGISFQLLTNLFCRNSGASSGNPGVSISFSCGHWPLQFLGRVQGQSSCAAFVVGALSREGSARSRVCAPGPRLRGLRRRCAFTRVLWAFRRWALTLTVLRRPKNHMSRTSQNYKEQGANNSECYASKRAVARARDRANALARPRSSPLTISLFSLPPIVSIPSLPGHQFTRQC